MRILLAEDAPVSQRLVQHHLQTWGHEVVTAANGAEAWQRFTTEAFPIVISDWMMPEMDGVELVRRIRAWECLGYVYIMLLTARAQTADLVEGMEAGADDFIPKPSSCRLGIASLSPSRSPVSNCGSVCAPANGLSTSNRPWRSRTGNSARRRRR